MAKDVTIISSTRYNRAKFTTTAKLTLTAFSLMGFIGGWNVIGRMEKQLNRNDQPTPSPSPWPTPAPISISPTPWPTIPPLTELAPIPTLVPTFTTATVGQPAQLATEVDSSISTSVQFAPIPTLAPLPALKPLPTIPPPPPPPPLPPPMPAGGGNSSGGS